MKRNDVFAAFAQKLGIGRNNLDDNKLSAGKVFLPFFASVFNNIKKELRADKKNYDTVDEFSSCSQNPWSYFNPDVTPLTMARLLTLHSGRTASKLRAECTHPRITRRILWEFLAEQMETSVSKFDQENMLVRDIKLPLSGYDKHSWLTFVIWANALFGQSNLDEKFDEISKMKVNQLFEFWLKE